MASTNNSKGNSGSKCANTAAADVRVHFTAQTAFSHLCDQFQDVVPMSSHRGWHISRKKRSQNCLAFAFESTSTWKLKSPQRRNWQNVTVNSSDNAENSEKNLSTVKPFFLDGGGRCTFRRRKTLLPEVIVGSKCSNEEKIQPSFRETWSPLRAITASPPPMRVDLGKK